MRVNVLGGGPGGLYLAILLKRADASHDVTVWERNAVDDTFGFGVVFSDLTQTRLRQADAPSYDAITESFARWDAIDVLYRGQVRRSSGHGFCGLSRKRLLQILGDRAQELGVTVKWHSERLDVEALRADCDLLVAADGLNSTVRAKYADAFGPTLDVRPNRYVWLGSTKPLPAFTFSFQQNEHGLFMLHAYQFEKGASTFIIECDAATYEASGLGAADEAATIAYCERVFAAELAGHRLVGNRSRWIQFATVKNEHWSHGNTVLIGDAAHTAHFSIGSGTKLAMEDAIALAAALAAEKSVPAALARYEKERRSDVDSIQRAAQASLEWFESAKRYMAFTPEQFNFSLLTRSMRVTHDNLKVRDAGLIDEADRWFAGGAPAADGAAPTPPMFVPFELAGMPLTNRVVVSPMCQYTADDGTPNDWHLVHLGSRAVGGAGLVIAEMTDVLAEGRISPGCAGMYKPEHVGAWRRITDYVHAHSTSKIGMQLAHAGRKGATAPPWEGEKPLANGAWPLIAPSPLAWREGYQVPREMTRADMDAVRQAFAKAARMADEAGFDLVEVHMAHGYLLNTFLSPITNVRTDDFGGSFANRARFPLQVLDAVRAAWPSSKPLSVRISATDWMPDGFDSDAAVTLAAMLKAHGADLIDVSAGGISPLAKPKYGRAFQTPFSDRIRNEVGIATIAVGNISTYDDINTILLAGRADLVALARAHLADPYFTLHAAREQGYEGLPWPKQYRSAASLKRLLT